MPKPPSKREHRQPEEMHLNITSLIDVLTILLVFLLKSYSAEPEGAVTTSKLIQLPTSASRLKIEQQITSVIVTKRSILIDGTKEVARIGGDWRIEGTSQENPLLIQGLVDALEEIAEKKKFIAKHNPNFQFEGEILIQADKQMPARVLAAVLFSVGQAGFDKIKLLSISKYE